MTNIGIPDACRRLGVSYWTVYKLVLSGALPAVRGLNGKWLLGREAVEQLARQREAERQRNGQGASA